MVSAPHAPEANVPDKKDARLNIKLNKSAERLRNTKRDFDTIYGRELTWDEFFDYLWTYIDLPAEKGAAAKAIRMLDDVKTYLADNREESSAEIVELFSCALRDVMHGKMEPKNLSNALVDL